MGLKIQRSTGNCWVSGYNRFSVPFGSDRLLGFASDRPPRRTIQRPLGLAMPGSWLLSGGGCAAQHYRCYVHGCYPRLLLVGVTVDCQYRALELPELRLRQRRPRYQRLPPVGFIGSLRSRTLKYGAGPFVFLPSKARNADKAAFRPLAGIKDKIASLRSQ